MNIVILMASSLSIIVIGGFFICSDYKLLRRIAIIIFTYIGLSLIFGTIFLFARKEQTTKTESTVIHRELEGLSTQQYISADGKWGMFSGYLTAQTDDKYRYYYRESNGSVKADVANMKNTVIRYTDDEPYLDIHIVEETKRFEWFIFFGNSSTETVYEYDFYVPEGSVIQEFIFN